MESRFAARKSVSWSLVSVAAAGVADLRGVVEWVDALSAKTSWPTDRLLGVLERSRRRSSSLVRSPRPRDDVEARGSPEGRKGESEGEDRRTEALLPRIWIEGTAEWVLVISRLPFRSSGKRDVRVERRRSAGGFSPGRGGAVLWSKDGSVCEGGLVVWAGRREAEGTEADAVRGR